MPVVPPQNIPPILNEVSGDERTERAISWIAKRWQLKSTDDFRAQGANETEAFIQSQIFLLSQTVGEVLAGKLHPNFVVKTLEERLAIPRDRARDIAHDVSREIFSRVRKELMDYYRIVPEQKVVHPTPQGIGNRGIWNKEGRTEAPEPVKPSMQQSKGIGNREQGIGNEEQETTDRKEVTPQQEPERKEVPQPPKEMQQSVREEKQNEPSPERQSHRPGLAEQVEEKSFPQNADGQEQASGDRGQGTENNKQKPPEHFEPGPGQVIDLR